jgi:hypothetical protein
MDWKAILALAVLVVPMAWCVADDGRQAKARDARIAEACLAAGHMWNSSWGGWCEERAP